MLSVRYNFQVVFLKEIKLIVCSDKKDIDGSPPGSPIPGDSPGKNTGVGCHFLLQCMKVKSESEVTQ